MSLNRRQLMNRSGAAGAGLVAASFGLGSPATAEPCRKAGAKKLFPPLESAPGDLLALPAGFHYEAVSVSGETDVHDGTGKVVGKTPERPDGTLVVRSEHGYRLVQNHEASPGSKLPVPLVEGTTYDPGALGGGCTVIDVTRSGRRRSEWVGLSGTISNCAGGPTPWGSWLTCEESEAKAGTGTLQKDHGYVFEVFADRAVRAVPQADQGVGPLRPRGRRHRAEPDPRLPHRGRRRPERAVLPLDRADRLPAAAPDRGRPRRRRRQRSRPWWCSTATAACCPTWPT